MTKTSHKTLEEPLINETIQIMNRHASVRRYKPDPLPEELVLRVVAAGQRASTSSNLQSYSVVAVTDPARRDRLATLCADQDFIRQAPVFLAWCADNSRLERLSRRRGYQQNTEYLETFLVAAVDAALAMQNAALAAESLGLGMCYVGSIRNHPDEVIEVLGLPPLVFPVCGMALGWPDIDPLIRPRLPLEAVLHWECYEPREEEELLSQYDRAMIATGIYKGRQVPVPGGERQPGIEGQVEDYGWQEHSARRVSRAYRTGLSESIRGQGYQLK